MIVVKHKGDFRKTDNFLRRISKTDFRSILEKYGREGVAALAAATPVDSGLTASSWSYEITISNGRYVIAWSNSNVNKGVPVAIILQYGHGTRNGGWVEGRDYINPAIQPIFDKIVAEAWREVTKP
jgi:hypothetical protein